MPQIRHIALATNDPEKTAAFYKEAFGFKEIARTKNSDDPKQVAYGVYLSDGPMYARYLPEKLRGRVIGILKQGEPRPSPAGKVRP